MRFGKCWLAGVALAALLASGTAAFAQSPSITVTGDVSPTPPPAASYWNVGGNLTVGFSGTGTLDIEGGARVEDFIGHVGYYLGSTGTVTVEGEGSTWANSNILIVASSGTGGLTIRDGGTVTNASTGYIGYGSLSTGNVTVEGEGSTWANSSNLSVGNWGTGTLNIENGGTVTNTRTGYIGSETGSTGTVTVTGTGSTGTGSRWSSAGLLVGYSGAGILNIADGGTVAVVDAAGNWGRATIAGLAGSTGTLNLDGTSESQGVLQVSQLEAGRGNASLIFDGGILRAGADQGDFLHDFAPGEVSIDDGGAFIDSNSFDIGIGTDLQGAGGLTKIGAGTLTLTGNNTYSGGTRITGGTLSVASKAALGASVDLDIGAPVGSVDTGSSQTLPEIAEVLGTAIDGYAADPTPEAHLALLQAQQLYAAAIENARTNGTLPTLEITGPIVLDGTGSGTNPADAPLGIDIGNAAAIFLNGPGADLTFQNYTSSAVAVGAGAVLDLDRSSDAGDYSFSNNTAPSGSAIYNIDGTVSLTGASFSGNSAHFYGGAILTGGGTATLTDVSFTGNSTTEGFGGAIAAIGTVRLTNASFTDNSAAYTGGAIYNDGWITLTGASFIGNSAPYGGAIVNYGLVTLTNASFTGNSAASWGGAIANAGVTVALSDVSFTGNSADVGGAIYQSVGTVSLSVSENATSLFSGNTAAGAASSIAIEPYDVGITAALAVDTAAGGLLDMRDPGTSSTNRGSVIIDKTGGGIWALGGDNIFASEGSGQTHFTVNAGALYLYGDREVDNDIPSTSETEQVSAGSLTLSGSGSSFALASDATLVAGGDNRIATDGSIILGDGATLRGGSASQSLGGADETRTESGGATSLSLDATGGVRLQGALNVAALAEEDTFILDGDLSEAADSIGSLTKTGAGTVVLTGASSYSGLTRVAGGTLVVGDAGHPSASVSGPVNVEAGATLGGSGTIGTTTVSGGAHFAPGNSIGTLTVQGDLSFAATSELDFELGNPGVSPSGGLSDRVDVSGNLTLDGTLNLSHTAGGTVGLGYYRLMTYGGDLIDNTLEFGTLPTLPEAGLFEIQTGNHNVNLYIGAAGNDALQDWLGGDGIWSTSTAQWLNADSEVPTTWAGNIAIFRDEGGFTGGVVEVEGAQSFKGLQFVDEDYELIGLGSLAIDGSGRTDGNAEIRVLADRATIATVITGTGGITKAEAGTLVLSGNNTYQGGTVLAGGAVEVSSDDNLGSGTLTFNGGTLRVTGTSLHATARAIIWGDNGGGFDIADTANTFDVDQDLDGPGGLSKEGAGTLMLSGDNSYSGVTNINAGTLRANDAVSLSSASLHRVNAGATLEISPGLFTTIGSLADGADGGGSVVLGGGAGLETGLNGATTTFSGSITGNGELYISGGALTLTGQSTINRLSIRDVASLTLSGEMASVTVDGWGTTAGGTLNVLDGAHLSTSAIRFYGPSRIAGLGSQIEVAQETVFDGFLPFTTISNGGLLTSHGIVVAEGPLPGMTPGVIVIGDGSRWAVGDDMFIGGYNYGGTGTVQVLNGGAVDVEGDVHIGASTDLGFDPSTVGVSGTGAVLDVRGGIVIGGGYVGSLAVAEGGTVRAESVDIGPQSLLLIGTGGLAGTVDAATIINNGAIIADFADAMTLAATVAGDGTFTKQGSGTLNYTGDGSNFTGTTTVAAGLLSVNGSLGGSVSVLSGGVLGGNGTLGSTTIGSGGIVAPGNSIGKLNVTGDITFAPGSTYEVEIAGNGGSDLIAATGQAFVNGGTVEVTALDPETSYQNGQSYTILTAAGGVYGAFDAAASESIFLNVSLEDQMNGIGLTIAIKGDEPNPPTPPSVFERVAATPNQYAIAVALDTLPQAGPELGLYNALLSLTSEAEAQSAFNQLSGEANASVKGMFIEQSGLLRTAMIDRLRAAFGAVGGSTAPVLSYAAPSGPGASEAGMALKAVAAPATTETFAMWTSGFGSWGEMDGNINAASLSSSTGGFLIGADATLGAGWRLGVTGGYSYTDFDVDARNSSGNSENWHVGLYGGNQWGALGLRTGLAYTWHDVDTTRSVGFTGFGDYLTGSYDAGTFQAFGELGYRIDTAFAVAFEPFANLAYVSLHTDGFGESGGAAALASESSTTDTSFTTLGLRASTQLMLGNAATTLRGALGWRHAFGDVVPLATQSFAGSEAFTVSGTPIAEDAALVEAGLDVLIGASTTLGVAYTGQFGDGVTQNGFNATLKVSF